MSHYHLYAVGNALVDSEYRVTDAELAQMGIDKGHMTLIDGPRRTELLRHLVGHPSRRTGGGSAGNTVVALAQLGGRGFYSCRVADDELGAFYAADLAANGVASNLSHTQAPQGQTGNCLVCVTPDAERSMSTFLGATAELDATALHPHDIEHARVYYMEGYLAASPTGLQAALEGKAIARAAGVAVALTLSDVSMIRFCRSGLQAMLDHGIDHLFCNEEEAQTWADSTDWPTVLACLAPLARTVCITRGARGSVVCEAGTVTEIEAPRVQAIDTNGAGDMFAGAFLYALTHGHGTALAARLGNHCAAAVVGQAGCRLSTERLQDLKRSLLGGAA